MKLINDSYYTPIEIAHRLCDLTFEIIGKENITDIIEPSAGNGAFSNYLECTAYDINPQAENIIKSNFLTQPLTYKKGRLFIGNPPFGNSLHLARKFYEKCCLYGDYIAFILPISQLNNNLQFYKFDLVCSEDLGVADYSGVTLHCVFNIYRRPENGSLNSKPNVKLDDIQIREYRRGTTIDVPLGYDYAMCNWGNGTLGKVPKYVGEYAQEVYFYCKDKSLVNKLIEILSYDKIRSYVQSISMKKISVARLYLYIRENIPNVK